MATRKKKKSMNTISPPHRLTIAVCNEYMNVEANRIREPQSATCPAED